MQKSSFLLLSWSYSLIKIIWCVECPCLCLNLHLRPRNFYEEIQKLLQLCIFSGKFVQWETVMSVGSFIALFLLSCYRWLFFSLSHSPSFLVCRDCPCLKHSYITLSPSLLCWSERVCFAPWWGSVCNTGASFFWWHGCNICCHERFKTGAVIVADMMINPLSPGPTRKTCSSFSAILLHTAFIQVKARSDEYGSDFLFAFALIYSFAWFIFSLHISVSIHIPLLFLGL